MDGINICLDSRFRGNDKRKDNDKNCILVVYLLAFDDVTCYNAGSSNLQTASPSGAAIRYIIYFFIVSYGIY